MITHAPCGAIAPEIPFTTTGHRVAQGLFPFHTIFIRGTFHDATAWPTHELGVQVNQHLCHISTLTIVATLESSLRKERHVIHEHRTRLVELQGKLALGGCTFRRQRGSQFSPVFQGSAVECCSTERRSCLTIHQPCGDGTFVVRRLHVETQVIFLPSLEANAPITYVLQHDLAALLHFLNGELHGMGCVRVERGLAFHHLALGDSLLCSNFPTCHPLFLQVPEDVPVLVRPVLIIHGIGGVCFAVLVGHARWQHMLFETAILY